MRLATLRFDARRRPSLPTRLTMVPPPFQRWVLSTLLTGTLAATCQLPRTRVAGMETLAAAATTGRALPVIAPGQSFLLTTMNLRTSMEWSALTQSNYDWASKRKKILWEAVEALAQRFVTAKTTGAKMVKVYLNQLIFLASTYRPAFHSSWGAQHPPLPSTIHWTHETGGFASSIMRRSIHVNGSWWLEDLTWEPSKFVQEDAFP